jgi:hypothetical protein
MSAASLNPMHLRLPEQCRAHDCDCITVLTYGVISWTSCSESVQPRKSLRQQKSPEHCKPVPGTDICSPQEEHPKKCSDAIAHSEIGYLVKKRRAGVNDHTHTLIHAVYTTPKPTKTVKRQRRTCSICAPTKSHDQRGNRADSRLHSEECLAHIDRVCEQPE